MVRLQRVTFLALHNYLGLTTELFNPVSAGGGGGGPFLSAGGELVAGGGLRRLEAMGPHAHLPSPVLRCLRPSPPGFPRYSSSDEESYRF